MTLGKYAFVPALLIAMSMAAQAAKLATNNSNYGFSDFGTDNQTPTSTCLDLNSVTCLLTEQTFYATNSSTLAVYDFKINSDLFNFTLKLDGNAALDNYGAFILDPGANDSSNPNQAILLANPVQFGPDATALAAAAPLGDGQGASFTVTGNGKGLVFFVVLDKPLLTTDPPPDPKDVTASIQLSTSPVPEPTLWPLLAIAIGGLLVIRRRRMARSS